MTRRLRSSTGATALALVTLTAAAVAQNNPRQAAADLAAGTANVAKGDLEEARSNFMSAQYYSPRDPDILFSLANIHLRLQEPLPALGWFRAVLAAAPNGPRATEISLRMAELRTQLKSTTDRIWDQAAATASRIEAGTPAQKTDREEAILELFGDMVAAGEFDRASRLLAGSGVSGQAAADAEDFALIARARLAALRNDFDDATSLFNRLRDPGFAVNGSYSSFADGRRSRNRSDQPRDFFWSRIADEAGTYCRTADDAFAARAKQRITGSYQMGRHLGSERFSVGSLGPVDELLPPARVAECSRQPPVDRWAAFARTACQGLGRCNTASRVQSAAEEPLPRMATQLGFAARLLGEELEEYATIEIRARPR